MLHRPQSARLPRRATGVLAVALATTGLLGQGLAMLLVSFLAGSPAAAQTDFPAFVEICTAEGLGKAAPSGNPSSNDRGDDEAPGPVSGKIDGCPVCNAFAQSGQADLPVQILAAGRVIRPALPSPVYQIAAPAPGERLPLSRGPPTA